MKYPVENMPNMELIERIAAALGSCNKYHLGLENRFADGKCGKCYAIKAVGELETRLFKMEVGI